MILNWLNSSIVDEKFEGFMADYDDENLGGLECDEIEGVKTENSETMKQIIGEYQKIKAEERQKPPVPNESSMTHLIESIENAGDKPDMDFLEIDDRDRKKDKWDCESILSTYSNLYNRPKLISENRIMVSYLTHECIVVYIPMATYIAFSGNVPSCLKPWYLLIII
jgi:protein LTV1